MNSDVTTVYRKAVSQLSQVYDQGEAESLINILFEDLLGITRQQRIARPPSLKPLEVVQLQAALDRLINHEPVQHIVGFAYFMGLKFLVTPDTLIPRPETEELVALITGQMDLNNAAILDIGTGSGCIAISLALASPSAKVTAWDVSKEALAIAQQNATNHNATVDFQLQDALSVEPSSTWDLIVSNPPYIPNRDRATMHKNVTDFEPGTALFVPDEDPLLFYHAIAELGKRSLHDRGKLYFEIHEQFGQAVSDLLTEMGYSQVTVCKDLQGKDRMVHAQQSVKPPSTH